VFAVLMTCWSAAAEIIISIPGGQFECRMRKRLKEPAPDLLD
jgi:hypothetical protein